MIYVHIAYKVKNEVTWAQSSKPTPKLKAIHTFSAPKTPLLLAGNDFLLQPQIAILFSVIAEEFFSSSAKAFALFPPDDTNSFFRLAFQQTKTHHCKWHSGSFLYFFERHIKWRVWKVLSFWIPLKLGKVSIKLPVALISLQKLALNQWLNSLLYNSRVWEKTSL